MSGGPFPALTPRQAAALAALLAVSTPAGKWVPHTYLTAPDVERALVAKGYAERSPFGRALHGAARYYRPTDLARAGMSEMS